jgi:hypothetical protein
VKDLKLVSEWKNQGELGLNFAVSLSTAIKNCPQTGWVRGDQIVIEPAHTDIEAITGLQEKPYKRANKIKNKLSTSGAYNQPVSFDKEINLIAQYRKSSLSPHSGNSEIRKKTDIMVTLKDIFRLIAPSILKEKINQDTIFDLNNGKIGGLFKKIPSNVVDAKVESAVVDELKAHFLHADFIDISVLQTVANTIGTFWMLTEKGADYLYNNLNYCPNLKDWIE